jgi:hypothetical protein
MFKEPKALTDYRPIGAQSGQVEMALLTERDFVKTIRFYEH